MPRSALITQQIAPTGLEPALEAANVDGNSIDGDAKTFLEVVNGGGAPINVTIQTPATLGGLAVADQVVAVTNGERRLIGPFPKNVYNRPSDPDAGKVYIDYSDVTSVTVGAFRLQ